MTPMTVAEALACFRVRAAGETSDQVEIAGGILLAKLREFSRRLRVSEEVREEATGFTVRKVLELGPRLPELSIDGVAHAWLRKVLYHKCIDLLRRTPREVSLDELIVGEDQPQGVWFPASSDEQWRCQLDSIVNGLSGPVERSAAAELVAIEAGSSSFDQVVDGEMSHSGSLDERKRVKNRKYKQYQRALAALHDAVDGLDDLNMWDREVLHNAIDGLRLKSQ